MHGVPCPCGPFQPGPRWGSEPGTPFHTYAIGDTANSEGLVDTAVLLRNNGTLKDLDTFLGAFFDLDVNANSIADANDGHFALDVLSVQGFNEINFHGVSS